MKARKSAAKSITAITLSVYLSFGHAQQLEPLEPLPNPVSPELTKLLACFTCARVRIKTEEQCREDIRQDGDASWDEEWGCFLQGMLAEQACLDALICY